MKYAVTLEGFQGHAIEVQPPGLLNGPMLLVDGQPAEKGAKRGEMILRKNDGKQVVAAWKPQFMGLDVPQLVVDGKVVSVAEPLKWYVWAWSAIPVGLLFIGGARGGLVGVIAFSINSNIFRSSPPRMATFALSGVVSIVAIVAYGVMAALPVGAIGR
jgi:hypothetical protein